MWITHTRFAKEVIMTKESSSAEWLTYREAQNLTGLGRTTLWRITNAGLIPVSAHGRARRLHRRSLEEYMWSRVTGGKDEVREDRR